MKQHIKNGLPWLDLWEQVRPSVSSEGTNIPGAQYLKNEHKTECKQMLPLNAPNIYHQQNPYSVSYTPVEPL
jgi:hypothetical protein